MSPRTNSLSSKWWWTELKNVCACVRLTLSDAFSIVWSICKFTPLNNCVLEGDFLAITTFDNNPIQQEVWHTEHFMRRVVSCKKTNFSEVLHPLNFSKNNFPLLKAGPNYYLFTADLVFPPIILNERPIEPTFNAAGQWRSYYLRFSALLWWCGYQTAHAHYEQEAVSCVHPLQRSRQSPPNLAGLTSNRISQKRKRLHIS